MDFAVGIATGGWVALVAAFFLLVGGRHAVIAAFLAGWLFLPIASYPLPGPLPDYTKTAVVCVGTLVAILLFERERALSLHFRLIDLPTLLWCAVPFASSLSNGLGWYDGGSAVLDHVITWGIPYAVGRMYFADLAALRTLAVGIVVGGLVYLPFCLIEMLIGPELHQIVYGYALATLDEAARFGGWRPRLFMPSGLMVAFYMAAAAVIAFWLWRSRARKQVARIPAGILVVLLGATTLLLKSVNGWMLLVAGTALLSCSHAMRARWARVAFLSVALAVVPLFVGLRASGLWSGEHLLPVVSNTFGDGHAGSIRFRLENERLIIERVQRRPLFGWGRWGRALALATPREGIGYVLVPDSLWILSLGESGFAGLITLGTTLLLPVALFWVRYPPKRWLEPSVAGATALAGVLLLYAIDGCVNTMVNPIYMLIAGGLLGLPADASGVKSSALRL